MSSKDPAGPGVHAAKAFTYPRLSAPAGEISKTETPAKSAWAGVDPSQFAMDPGAEEEREKQAWQRGFDEGRANSRVEYDNNLAALRSEIGKALAAFAAERDSYFHRVEREVVQLTLSIARKILRRESQIDPLLLTGLLRVALEKANTGSTTRLRVNPSEIERWRDYFKQNGENFPVPELVGDPQLEPFRCVLETEVGTTEIGLETHLKEIEEGFMDLLSKRPGQTPGPR